MVEHYGNTFTLTYEEKIVIEMIIEGCTRLICRTSEDDPLKYARARSHYQTKPLVHTFVILHIHDMIKENSNIRPSYIRKRLPESFQNIQDADLSRILKSTLRTNMLSKTEEEVNRRRPGHPFNNDNNDNSMSNPTSFYGYSNYQKILEQVLSKPEARNKLYSYLLESGLLYMYHVTQGMKAYYIEKENDKVAAWNLIQSSEPPNTPPQSSFEEHFSTQNRLLNQANKIRIREKSQSWARSFIERHNADDYLYLYRIGGLYYFAHTN
jgi:hypothetical protein